MVRRSIFEQIFSEIRSVRFRLEDIERNLSTWKPQPIEVKDSAIFALPDHLRRTYLIVASNGECTAEQVSGRTGKCRALESNYLNQLVCQGWLNKRRVSKTQLFRVSTTPKALEATVGGEEK